MSVSAQPEQILPLLEEVPSLCLCVCLNINHRLGLTKTLTIRDEVYNKLTSIKKENESFSELFERLVEGTGSIEALKNLRGTVEFRDKKRMLAEIEALRSERRQ